MPAVDHLDLPVITQASGALQLQSVSQSTASGTVFSPQNWLKGKGAVNDEQLVAGAIVNVLKGLNTPELAPIVASLTIPADRFSFCGKMCSMVYSSTGTRSLRPWFSSLRSQ